MTTLKQITTLIAVSYFITACGGGGGGSSNETAGTNPEPSVLVGSFVDSPVEGLRYTTPTRTGLTNSLGEFKYLDGEQVTFSIGGTTLGVAKGREIVTPFTLLGIKPINKEARITATLIQSPVSSFERAINIAMLLQTLDSDGDPDNGIDLGNADSLLRSDTVNLIEKSISFLEQSSIQTVKTKTGASHSRNLLSSVKHLYESLEIQIESNQVSQLHSILDKDKTQSTSFDYNEDGKVVEERIDRDGNGTIDIVKHFQYDANGNVIHTTNSLNNISENMTYNANNQLITRTTSASDGSSSIERYSYNNDNQISRFELDKDDNGSIDSTTLYQYLSGNVVSYTIDKDGDDIVDASASYIYDNGKVVTYMEDNNDDGTPELIIAYAYDSKGNRQSYNINVSSPGYPSAPGKFTYDQYDNVTRYELDIDLDGEFDYLETYTYNTNHQRTSFYRDSDGDGDWDRIIQYKYNEDGQRIQMAEDNDGNGIADKVWTGNYQPKIVANAWDLIISKL